MTRLRHINWRKRSKKCLCKFISTVHDGEFSDMLFRVFVIVLRLILRVCTSDLENTLFFEVYRSGILHKLLFKAVAIVKNLNDHRCLGWNFNEKVVFKKTHPTFRMHIKSTVPHVLVIIFKIGFKMALHWITSTKYGMRDIG